MKKYYIKYKINLKLINLNQYKNFITKYFLFYIKIMEQQNNILYFINYFLIKKFHTKNLWSPNQI